MNGAAAIPADPNDVCSFGHQLAPGSDPIVIKTFDTAGRKVAEETFLLRRHYAPLMTEGGIAGPGGVAPTDPKRLVGYPCEHALKEVPPGTSIMERSQALSYGRAHFLTYESARQGQIPIPRALCPVCRGEPEPADWTADRG